MKWRFAIPISIFVALCVVLGWMLYRTGAKGYDVSLLPSPLIGKSAPEFRLPRLDSFDQFVDNRELTGQMYLLNVWATWCVECRHEHPVLLAIAQQNVLPIVGLDTKDELADAQQWLATLGNPYFSTAFDGDGRVALDWGVYGAPETFLVNAHGIIIYKHVGALTMSVWQQKFLPLITTPSTTAVTP